MIIMLYWTLFIYVIVYSGMFSSCKDKNNNGQKRTQRTSTY